MAAIDACMVSNGCNEICSGLLKERSPENFWQSKSTRSQKFVVWAKVGALHGVQVFNMDRASFVKLPKWRQLSLKKDRKLF